MASWARKFPQAVEDEPRDKLEDLFVFGYACKLFRDDERAKIIDQGTHLIPWMGDSTLLIDRYDGRGHLYDLAEYDADNITLTENVLSEAEKRIEAVCEEERYLELHHDMQERQLYEEEEIKRLNEACSDNPYAAVGFNYSYVPPEAEPVIEEPEPEPEPVEPAFVVPEGLQVPEGMHVPPNEKIHLIIEKTATFVGRQGAQLEIRIKLKQKDNPQFDFLNIDHYLNPFYKHVVSMIKSGKYHPKPPEKKPEPGSYLHPSLNSGTPPEPAEPELTREGFLDSVRSKLQGPQITNTLYAKLVSKLSKHTAGRNSPDPSAMQMAQQQQQQQKPVAASTPPYNVPAVQAPQPPPPPVPLPVEAVATSVASLPPSAMPTHGPHLPQHMPSPPQIMHGPAPQPQHSASLPPPPGMEPVTLPSHNQPPPPGTEPVTTPAPVPPPNMLTSNNLPHMQANAPISNKVGETVIQLPPPEIQPIIDKMAVYVAKNGPDFELVVRSKNDERFQFLHPWHPQFPYYKSKRDQYIVDAEAKKAEEEAQRTRAVSFSIKTKQKEAETTSLNNRPALLCESSDEEGEGSEKKPEKEENEEEKPIPGEEDGVAMEPVEEPEPAPAPRTSDDEKEKEVEEDAGSQKSRSRESSPGSDKPIVTPEMLAKLEKRQAEMRLRDKMALAGREKLNSANKEKQLQAERKRRAAMFISMLKKDGPAPAAPAPGSDDSAKESPMIGPVLPASLTGSPLSSPFTSKPSSPLNRNGSSLTASPARLPSPAPAPVQSNPQPKETLKRSRSSPSSSSSSSRSRSRSKSPSKSPEKKKRAKTPPSAYAVVRRSRSPVAPRRFNSRSRSRTPLQYRRNVQNSRNISPIRTNRYPGILKRRSRSRSKSKSKHSKHRSRSKSPKAHKRKSRSKSKERKKSKKKDKDKDEKKSKHRSRSRSKSKIKEDRAKSRSRSESKAKEGKERDGKSHSPKRDKKSRSKSPKKEKKHKRKSRSKSRSKSPSKKKSKKKSRSRSPDHKSKKDKKRDKKDKEERHKERHKDRHKDSESRRDRRRNSDSDSPPSKRSSSNHISHRNGDASEYSSDRRHHSQSKTSSKRPVEVSDDDDVIIL